MFMCECLCACVSGVCMCEWCMHVSGVCTGACVWKHISMLEHMCIFEYVCKFVSACVCMHMHVCVCMRMCVCMSVFVMYECVCAHV